MRCRDNPRTRIGFDPGTRSAFHFSGSRHAVLPGRDRAGSRYVSAAVTAVPYMEKRLDAAVERPVIPEQPTTSPQAAAPQGGRI